MMADLQQVVSTCRYSDVGVLTHPVLLNQFPPSLSGFASV